MQRATTFVRTPWHFFLHAALGAAALAAPTLHAGTAAAQCATSAWGVASSTVVGAPTSPAHDTFVNQSGNSRAYLAQGTSLVAVRNVAEVSAPAGAAGSVAWTWAGTAASINNFASPVVITGPGTGLSGAEYIFLTGTDGFLYKIPADGSLIGTTSKDTRRGSCTADQLVSTPSIQLHNYATANPIACAAQGGAMVPEFQCDMTTRGRAKDDIVIVITKANCGAGGLANTTQNRIIAYYASDLTMKWKIGRAHV